MGEGRSRRRVSEVVSRYVNALYRGDRSLVGRSDPFLQFTEVGTQGRLITDRGGHAAEQSRNFSACLGEPENVVNEQKNVLALDVAEVFGDRKPGKRNTGAGPRRFGHLAVNQPGTRKNPGILHFVIEVVSFTGPLANARKNRNTAVLHGDVVDHLHHNDGFADACAAEHAHLAAARKRNEQVDNLYAGLEDFDRGILLGKTGRRTVNRHVCIALDRAEPIHGPAHDVDNAAEDRLSRRAS